MTLTLRTFILFFQCLIHFPPPPVSSAHSFPSNPELVFLFQILYKILMCFWEVQIPSYLVKLICNAGCQRNQRWQIRVSQSNVTCLSQGKLYMLLVLVWERKSTVWWKGKRNGKISTLRLSSKWIRMQCLWVQRSLVLSHLAWILALPIPNMCDLGQLNILCLGYYIYEMGMKLATLTSQGCSKN